MKNRDTATPLSESTITMELANIQKRCSELLEDTGTFSELKLEDPTRPAEGFDPYDRA